MIIKVNYTVSDVYMSTSISPVYIKVVYSGVSGGGGTWGTITGTLSAQTDLQAALDAKFDDPTGTTAQYLRGDGSLATFPTIPSGTVTSVGLSMPTAFAVANSPVTSSGTIAVTGAGTASQYIRGDGQLATLPSGASGGSSVAYYLNGGTAASVGTYYQMSTTAVLGTAADFSLVGNGLISQFLTDVGDPNRLEIPAGNWNFEMYFNISSSGGNTAFYVELLKYDGTTFTSIASNVGTPEAITGGTSIDLYLTSLAIPQTTLLVTDRLALRVYIVNNSGGRTVTLHTQDSHLCEIITNFAGGVSALNGLTANTQYFATGTSGTDFGISSVSDTHTFNLPTASATNRGALSSADWTTFNNKVPLARTLTINGTAFDLSADRSWTIPSSNIYNSDGTLTAARTLTSGGFPLTFTGSNTAASAIARGLNLTHTLVASANSDVLVGLDINPTFTNGAFTGVENVHLRLVGTSSRSIRIFASDSSGIASITNDISSSLVYTTGFSGHLFKFNNGTNLSTPLTISHNLIHGGNNNTSCGNSSNRWSNVFSVNVSSDIYQFQGVTTLAFGGYTVNTGIHFDLTNKYINFWANNSQAARITAAGRLLLGTTTESTYLLDVNGTARVSGALTAANNSVIGGVTFVGSDAVDFSSSISLRYGGNTRLNITSTNTAIGGSVGTTITLNTNSIAIGETGGIGGANAKIMLGQYAGYSSSSNGDFVSIGAASFFSTTNPTNGIAIGGRNAGAGAARGNTGNHTTCFFFGSNTGASTNSISLSNTYIIGNDVRTDLSNVFMLGKSNQAIMVGEGTSVGSGAIFQIDSTTKGFLPPRMTTTQRDAIATPATGLVIYNTTLNSTDTYDGARWRTDADTTTTNRQTASYSLVLADRGKLVEMNSASANTLTVPLNSSIAFPIGSKIDVTQYGAGATTITAASGVTIRSFTSFLKIAGQYAACTLVKIGTDEWYCYGNLIA